MPAKLRVIETRARENVEFELAIGGVQRFFDLTLDAKIDEYGEVDGVVGTVVDLTERRRREADAAGDA